MRAKTATLDVRTATFYHTHVAVSQQPRRGGRVIEITQNGLELEIEVVVETVDQLLLEHVLLLRHAPPL